MAVVITWKAKHCTNHLVCSLCAVELGLSFEIKLEQSGAASGTGASLFSQGSGQGKLGAGPQDCRENSANSLQQGEGREKDASPHPVKPLHFTSEGYSALLILISGKKEPW